mmetsp:Transcript_7548/g.18730  ORF Transcript_7548/g.18730 Transcript_7548/m.18730 type:complete len:206 (+) Transcript_7548:120-737(+)
MFTKPSRIVAVIIASMAIHAGAFSAQPPSEQRPPRSAEEHQHQRQPQLSQPIPATDNPYTLLGFDRLSPPKDFTVIHRAYRNLAKRHHPDVAVGPDATLEERERANSDFARISEAYEGLKARQDEEEVEVVIMGGNFAAGKRDRRVKYKTSERIRQNDPTRVNYDKILELRERQNLKGRNWSDPGEYEFSQGGRHNGDFGPPRRW